MTVKQVWDNLANAFEDSGLTRNVGLLKDLVNATLDTSSSTEDYVNTMMCSAHKLRNIGFQVDDVGNVDARRLAREVQAYDYGHREFWC